MNENNVNYDMLENVKQPRLAKTLIKLSEVYREYMKETNMACEKLGVPCDRQQNNFIISYNKLTAIIAGTIASIMDVEVNEAVSISD